ASAFPSLARLDAAQSLTSSSCVGILATLAFSNVAKQSVFARKNLAAKPKDRDPVCSIGGGEVRGFAPGFVAAGSKKEEGNRLGSFEKVAGKIILVRIHSSFPYVNTSIDFCPSKTFTLDPMRSKARPAASSHTPKCSLH